MLSTQKEQNRVESTYVLDLKILVLLTKLRAAEQHIKARELLEKYHNLKNVLFTLCRQTETNTSDTSNFNDETDTILEIATKTLHIKDPPNRSSRVSAAVKMFIAEIEERNIPGCAPLLHYYKQQGIYKMLYHDPVLVGDVDKRHMRFIIYILGIVAAAIAFFVIVSFLGLTGGWVIAANALFAGAVAYLSGILYGICNDMFAARSNLPYFLLGHQYSQKTFFLSNDPNVQAIGWGVLATHDLSIIFAVIFVVVVASVMAATASPFVSFILPCMFVATTILSVFADLLARSYAKGLPKSYEKTQPGSNSYQRLALEKMCPTKEAKARWFANSARNLFGYIAAPTIGVTGLVLTLTLPNLPVIFFSPLLSTILPIVAAGLAVVVLGAMLTYFFVNCEKQVDDRYKLCTKNEYSIRNRIKNDTLYLDEETNSEQDVYNKFFSTQLSSNM